MKASKGEAPGMFAERQARYPKGTYKVMFTRQNGNMEFYLSNLSTGRQSRSGSYWSSSRPLKATYRTTSTPKARPSTAVGLPRQRGGRRCNGSASRRKRRIWAAFTCNARCAGMWDSTFSASTRRAFPRHKKNSSSRWVSTA